MNYQDYIASIGLTAATFAPNHTALCQGQLLPINQNQALFSLVGTMYGGDGRSSFGLPDLRGRIPVGTGASIAGPAYVPGEELPVLTQLDWPQGWPQRAGAGEAATTPTTAGPSGIALNWAIALYGYFPPRD